MNMLKTCADAKKRLQKVSGHVLILIHVLLLFATFMRTTVTNPMETAYGTRFSDTYIEEDTLTSTSVLLLLYL
jgi:hypothetical protein